MRTTRRSLGEAQLVVVEATGELVVVEATGERKKRDVLASAV
jgi:hypothetical protein